MRRVLAISGGAAVGAAAVLAGHALAPTTGTTARPNRAATSALPPDATASSTASPMATRQIADGTATGPLIQTMYGPVQIRVTVAAGRIVKVVEVKLPFEHEHSRWIVANLVPQLRQRVLAAQSADVDMVSGATYTSQGYLDSLQAALDQLS